jgi:hypothetical protein
LTLTLASAKANQYNYAAAKIFSVDRTSPRSLFAREVELMTPEEHDVLIHAAALLLAGEGIYGTDKTLPAKIDAVIAEKDAEMEGLKRFCLDGPELRDIEKLVPGVARLSEEQGILVVARYILEGKYDQMLRDKPKAYVALHGFVTLSRTFCAAAAMRFARLIGGGPALSESERERATRVILTASD